MSLYVCLCVCACMSLSLPCPTMKIGVGICQGTRYDSGQRRCSLKPGKTDRFGPPATSQVGQPPPPGPQTTRNAKVNCLVVGGFRFAR